MTLNILALSGSIRKRSINRAALLAAAELAPDHVELTLADIGELPHYNGDLDGDSPPAGVVQLKDAVIAADGLLISTPEYNYSFSGVLKNAIDWVSRPAYRSPLANKPIAIMGASPSPVGSARAQGQLKQVLLGTVSNLFPHPEMLIPANAFDENLILTDPKTKERLERMMTAYAAWIRP